MIIKIKAVALVCFMSLSVILCGCDSNCDKLTLKKLVDSQCIDLKNRSDVASIRFDNYIYDFNNRYNNDILEILNTLDKYVLDESSEFEDTEEKMYLSFRNINYDMVSFLVNENDDIKMIYNVTDKAYYHCDGIYEDLIDDFQSFMKKDYYQVLYNPDTMLYEYEIYDKDKNILESDTISDMPYITRENEDIVCFWHQSGTGTLTRISHYYNVKTGEKSPVYYGQTDSFKNLTCNTGHSIVEVSDIFSGEVLYTIDEDDFEETLSDCMENIVSAYFTDDGKQIHIIYMNAEYQKRDCFFDILK